MYDLPTQLHAELFVYVGEQQEAEDVAKRWRFLPKAWSDYVDVADPRTIGQQAQQEVPLEDVLEMWTVSADPQQHICKLHELIDGGVTHRYVNAGNDDQMQANQFYRDKVLPQVRSEYSRAV